MQLFLFNLVLIYPKRIVRILYATFFAKPIQNISQ